MAPFLRYTEKAPGGVENHDKVIFVNADHVSKATWHERNGTLEVIYQLPSGKHAHSTARLEGDEAREAMQLLLSLK